MIYNKEHFKDALAFAKKLGGESKESFRKCLTNLNRVKRGNNWNLCIYPDFVKHSFEFGFYRGEPKRENLVYNGGMLLHGFQETYAVELSAEKFPHWSIHT